MEIDIFKNISSKFFIISFVIFITVLSDCNANELIEHEKDSENNSINSNLSSNYLFKDENNNFKNEKNVNLEYKTSNNSLQNSNESNSLHDNDDTYNEEIYDENFVEEWDNKMKDYVQDIMFTTILEPNRPKFFYEEINEITIQSLIKGAFVVESDKKEKIDLTIMLGQETLLETRGGQKIFSIKPSKTGILVIMLHSDNKLKITFTIGTGRSKIVTKDHLEYSDEKLNSLLQFVKKYKLEKKVLSIKHNEKNKSKFLYKKI